MVHCCHCITWSLNKTISFISIFILICKYNSVRKLSVLSTAVRADDTLKQTRLYDCHLNNITAVWNYPSQAIMKTSLVLCLCQRGLVRPTQLHSFWIQHTIIILIFIYSLLQKKKWFHSFSYNFEILLHSLHGTAVRMLRQKFTRKG